ncbi:uncharacterized protein PpBr36_10591 [Pyricularia pennisetigena]|uniref:uncharacterized protein n=1 Tax=Pyricularia pennisetigena TaxID=1578925 RepID=UPI0011533C96|nr:uncharacterized protein PpBr36_10591 [Pyricularia pennisetigena]TLS21155.1 hypothetical protein PpBr36_10591 [Pyricularia pennisetigena]
MNSPTRQGPDARAVPKLRGTPLKLRRALRQAQAERDKKLEDMERDYGANIPSKPKTQRPRGQMQDAGRRGRPFMDLQLPSRPRKSAGDHVNAQSEQAQRHERLEIRVVSTSPAVNKVPRRQCAPRAPATPPPRRSSATENSSQGGKSSSESESDGSSSYGGSSDDNSSDDEHIPVRRRARTRVKLSKSQKRDLLVEFVAREKYYLAALANGAKCHRDMPFWIDIRKRLRLVEVAHKWSDLSGAFGVIVGPRERQAMAGKKVPCKSDIERLIESCARIRIRRGILDGFVEDKLLNPNIVPDLIESGDLEQCELLLGEMQHLRRKQRAHNACDGADNADEESDAQDESESDNSSDDGSSDDSNDGGDDDGGDTTSASEDAHQAASSPPTSPITTSPCWPHTDEASSPTSTTAATYHADTDAAVDEEYDDDDDDSVAIEQAIALLQRRQARKRKRPESRADVQWLRRIRMQHEKRSHENKTSRESGRSYGILG